MVTGSVVARSLYLDHYMPLDVNQREIEGIVILDLTGRLVAGAEASDLRRHFDSLRSRQQSRVILNLKQLDYIDSTGLGTMVIGHSTASDAGGNVKLVNLSKRSAQLLILTKLATVFEIFDDEQTAINSFFPDREIKPFDILEFVKSHEGEKHELGSEPEPSES
jgi:anti-sigma B factor antagonist